MKTSPQSMRANFEELFCSASAEEASSMCSGTHTNKLTTEQLWAIVKLCKYVRLRARNNAAFNNLFNQVFPYATFSQVTKQRLDGSYYPGLKITIEGTESVESEEEES